MRKILICLLLIVFTFGCVSCNLKNDDGGQIGYPPESPIPSEPTDPESDLDETDATPESTDPDRLHDEHGEMRGVWISYLDYELLLANKSQQEASQAVTEAFTKAKDMGLNTVFLHVRPFADAIYSSEFFPWSHILKGEQSMAPGYDPFAMMVEIGHSMGLDIHAWINPYRVQLPGRPDMLSDDNQARIWLDGGGEEVIEISEGIFLNPANENARELVLNGVREIVENYDVDGIHFDDYFYPTTDPSFDAASYAAYLENGGELELADWRLENVNILVRDTYSLIKEIDQNVVFGISPQGNMRNNYETQYADVNRWCSEEGYIDYIMPQVYFGYNHDLCPYTDTILAWNDIIKIPSVKLYVGISPYKIGVADEWAGVGADEWVENSDVLMRQVIDARTLSHYGGFVLYRFDSLFNPEDHVSESVAREIENLVTVLG